MTDKKIAASGEEPQNSLERGGKRLSFWLIILFVGLLFTFVLWDHYFNSKFPLDRQIISALVLVMGTLFSGSAALLARNIEKRGEILNAMVKKRTQELEDRNRSLQQAMDEIQTLQGLIPICASCKKIRDDKGFWQQLELYFEQKAGTRFTHGLCKECIRKLYPDYAR